MTPEQVIERFGDETLSFHYYYKGTFEFTGTNSNYIFKGYVKIDSMENDEFELFPFESINVREFKEKFTRFEVWRYKPSKPGKLSKAELVYRSIP